MYLYCIYCNIYSTFLFLEESRLKELMKDEKPLDKKLEKEFAKVTANTQDEYFDKFKKRIQREPKQVSFHCKLSFYL